MTQTVKHLALCIRCQQKHSNTIILCDGTNQAKCDFLSVKVASKVFVDLVILNFFLCDIRLENGQKPFYMADIIKNALGLPSVVSG